MGDAFSGRRPFSALLWAGLLLGGEGGRKRGQEGFLCDAGTWRHLQVKRVLFQ